MNTFYNNYKFQEIHCTEGLFLKSCIESLNHSCRILSTNIDNISYSETCWGYSFPSFLNDCKEINLWNKWSENCKQNNIVAELIKIPPFFDINTLKKNIFDELHKVSKTCALVINGDKNQLFYNKKTRYLINKASREITYRKANKADINLIHDLYLKSMFNLKAEKRFFLDLKAFQFLFEDLKSSFHLAFYEKKLIGFVCFIFDENISHYHISANNQEGRYFNANYLLLSKAIEESISLGMRLVHFGGGLSSKDDDPLFRFKKKFSNCTLDYWLGLSIHNEELFKKYRNTKSNKVIDFIKD
jgi:hypothetical protein